MEPETGHAKRCCYCGHGVSQDASCASCGASAQDRLLWVLVNDLRLWRPGGSFLHHRPSAAAARRFYALLGADYHPTLPREARSPAPDVMFHAFDLATECEAIAPGSYSLIAITSGLAELGAALPATLEALTRALKPGGSMLFGGDIVDSKGAITSAELVEARGGARGASFAGFVRKQFGDECRVRPTRHILPRRLEAAGVSAALVRRVSDQSLFWHQS